MNIKEFLSQYSVGQEHFRNANAIATNLRSLHPGRAYCISVKAIAL